MKGKPRDDKTQRSAGRLYIAFAFLALVVLIGAGGYKVLGPSEWTWFDAFYMTIITLSTVGYGETLAGMEDVPWAREWTVGLIMTGTGSLLYFVSMLTAFVVEGDLRGLMGRRSMQRLIDNYRQHIVLCGVGTTGQHVLEELIKTKTPYVVIEHDDERISELLEDFGDDFIYIDGDATDDDILVQAGVERARGVLSCLRDDRDNLFVTISAKALNDKVRVVSRAVEASTEKKLRRAGADSVVSPNTIGGMRLVSEMIRPSVVQFLDVMLKDSRRHVRIESALVPAGSPMVGKALRDSGIREQTDLLIIALAEPDGTYVYNPAASQVITAGQTLVVMGETDELGKLKTMLG